jgi:hypothetical protein
VFCLVTVMGAVNRTLLIDRKGCHRVRKLDQKLDRSR